MVSRGTIVVLVLVVLLAVASINLVGQRRSRIESDERVEEAGYAIRLMHERTTQQEAELRDVKAEVDGIDSSVEAIRQDLADVRRKLDKSKDMLSLLRGSAVRTRASLDERQRDLEKRVTDATATKDGKNLLLKRIRDDLDEQSRRNTNLINEVTSLRRQLDLPQQTEREMKGLVNGVIVYVFNKHKETISRLKSSMTLLELNFLRCYPYPIVLFAEQDVEEDTMKQLAALVPSAPSVTFERTCFDVCTPPGYPSHDDVWKWLDKVGYGWPGYAAMCRFYSGTMYLHPALAQYDYYWRFDTDSYLVSRLTEDPFARMARDGCLYAYNNVNSDPFQVVQNLYPTVLNYLASHTGGVAPLEGTNINPSPEFKIAPFPDATLPTVSETDVSRNFPDELIDGDKLWQVTFPLANITRMKSLLGADDRSYNRLVYWTNFEIAAFAPFRTAAWMSVFRAIDVARGFYQYRWGDAPIHMIAVPLLMPPQSTCFINNARVNYAHRGSYEDVARSLLMADEQKVDDVCFPAINLGFPDLGGSDTYRAY